MAVLGTGAWLHQKTLSEASGPEPNNDDNEVLLPIAAPFFKELSSLGCGKNFERVAGGSYGVEYVTPEGIQKKGPLQYYRVFP